MLVHLKGGGEGVVTYGGLRTGFHIVGKCRLLSKFMDSPLCLMQMTSYILLCQ